MKLNTDLVMEIPGLIPKSFCDHIINKFELDRDEVPLDIKDDVSRYLEISGKDSWKTEDDKISLVVKDVINLYTKYLEEEYNFDQDIGAFDSLVKWVKEGLHDTGYTIEKRCEGFKSNWHCHDNRDPYNYIFGIIYLNTVEPSDDGTTEFINGRKIRPECGKIMICPANWSYAYRENKINTGNRYAITFKSYLNVVPSSDII